MFRSVILILLFGAFAALSGCSTLKSSGGSKPTVYTDPASPQTPDNSANSAEEDPLTKNPQPQLEQATQPNDLYQRLRNGFALPELRSNEYTQDFIRWSIEHPTYLNNLFGRANFFLHYFIEEVEKRGLPMELALLPAVESAYKPNATSRSKAAGLWQFIPSTGRHFGLEQNWWYDGRRDMVKSTNAALDYLTQLNKTFNGDWLIALAAYNAGQGNIRRAIRRNLARSKPADYESLDLRLETRRYVPKLLALKAIIQHPEQYGVSLPELQNEATLANIELKQQINLDDFAKRLNINSDDFRFLNTSYKRWASPPINNRFATSDQAYYLVLPLEKLDDARVLLAQMAKEPRIEYASYTIRSGDTLGAIARKYGVTVSALKTTNELRSSRIRIGKQLLIPSNPNAGLASKSRSKSKQSGFQGSGVTGNALTHQVNPGDTLWSIAKRYQVQIEQLLSWNNLAHNQTLYPNQLLKILR